MGRNLNLCIVMLEELGLSFPPPFPYKLSPCVSDLGGRVPWRREVAEPDLSFVRFPTWREGILVLIFMINKYVILFLFQSMCLVYWIFDFDYMIMFIRIGFHVSLNIISFDIIKLVWGMYNSFCTSLGARGERRGLKGCMDQPSFG